MSGAIVAAGIGAAGAIGGAAISANADRGGTQRRSRYTPAQEAILKKMSGRIQPEIGSSQEAYNFDVVPGETQLHKAMAGIGSGVADTVPMVRNRASDLLKEREWQPDRARERWQQAVMEPARRQYMEEQLPALQEKFAGMGAVDSSGFNRAVAESSEDLVAKGQSQLADLMYRDWQSFQDREIQRAQAGSSLLSQSLQQASQLGGIGETMRGVEREQREEQLKKWEMEQPYNNPWLQNYLGTVLGQPGATYTRESPSAQHQIGTGLMTAGLRGLSGGIGRMGGSFGQNQQAPSTNTLLRGTIADSSSTAYNKPYSSGTGTY